MIVRPDQVHRHLSSSERIHPVYYVFGEEPLQQMESCDAIRGHLRQQGYTERLVLDIDAQFDWQRFSDEVNALSLFASRRIIELRMPSGKPGRQGAQVLKDYCQHPVEDTVVMVQAGKADKSAKKTAWFTALAKHAVMVECWPIRSEQLPEWIGQRCRRVGLEADDAAIACLCEHIEGNLLAASQEIEKLLLLSGPGKIHFDDVVEAITAQSRFTMFELFDVMLRGDDRSRVVKIFQGVQAEGVEAVPLNVLLAREIRLLCQLSEAPRNIDFQLQRMGVWKSRAGNYKACLSRHRPSFFRAMLKRCAYIDRATKGVASANAWDEILTVVYRVSGKTHP